MPSLLTRFVSATTMSLVAGLALAWGSLPARWRRLLGLLTSALGLAFLIVAVNTEGQHESSMTAVFLMGAPYMTQQASALASLPYYVLTGICLLTGTLALAAGDGAALALAEHWMSTAVGLGVFVSLARFALEKAAAGEGITTVFGVTWLAPVVGAYFFLMLKGEGTRRWRLLVRHLLVYALMTRVVVIALYEVATTLRLGTHYDISSVAWVRSPFGHVLHFAPGSFAEMAFLVLLPQVVVWPLYTLLSGLLGAFVLKTFERIPSPPLGVETRLPTTEDA